MYTDAETCHGKHVLLHAVILFSKTLLGPAWLMFLFKNTSGACMVNVPAQIIEKIE